MTTDLMHAHSPLPWVVDDNRDGFEGLVIVFDADGHPVMSFGDMEDCEARDIADAHLVVAAVNASRQIGDGDPTDEAHGIHADAFELP